MDYALIDCFSPRAITDDLVLIVDESDIHEDSLALVRRCSEYPSERHANTCTRFNIQLSVSKPGSPWLNGYVERCIKSVKEELGPLARYQDITGLYIGITNAVAYYNNDRIHTSLKMTPRAYAKPYASSAYPRTSVTTGEIFKSFGMG